jgi:hypothetical protein
MRDPILPKYWVDHHIDVIDFLGTGYGKGDYRGRTSDLTGKWDDPTNYYGIWFDKHEIDALWPPPRRKLSWRNPLTWRTDEPPRGP